MPDTLRVALAEAKVAVQSAHARLIAHLSLGAMPARANKVMISERVGASLAELERAQAKLERLEQVVGLDDLAQARAALLESERRLETAILRLKDLDSNDKTYVSPVVAKALAELVFARDRLATVQQDVAGAEPSAT